MFLTAIFDFLLFCKYIIAYFFELIKCEYEKFDRFGKINLKRRFTGKVGFTANRLFDFKCDTKRSFGSNIRSFGRFAFFHSIPPAVSFHLGNGTYGFLHQ